MEYAVTRRRRLILVLVLLSLLAGAIGGGIVQQWVNFAHAIVTCTVPNTFATQAGPTIPLSQLDTNFTTLRDCINLAAAFTDLPLTRNYTGIQAWAKGTDVASAHALTIGSDGNYFVVTGTTNIFSVSSLQAGGDVCLRFSGVLNVVHNASTLILQGGVNMITASGDILCLKSEGGGSWRELSRRRASTGGALFLNAHGEYTSAAAGTVTAGAVNRTTGDITTTSTSLTDLTDASITITTGATRVLLTFTASTMNSSAEAYNFFNFVVDGALQNGTAGIKAQQSEVGGSEEQGFSMTFLTAPLTAGSHTFKVQWKVSTGTGTVRGDTATPYHFAVLETGAAL